MDRRVFDAMLKTALEEAIRQDMEDAPAAPPPSRRQRQRMKQLLTDAFIDTEAPRRRGNPARWLAVVVIAALLTGTAAGYALGGGQRFRQLFEASPWAAVYGGAADTNQLLEMGGTVDTLAAESNGLRFEMLDTVSDGQMAMASVRMTVMEEAVLERIAARPGGVSFAVMELLSESGEMALQYGMSLEAWTGNADLMPGEYDLVFSVKDENLSQGGTYTIVLQDFTGDGECLLAGTWTLSMTLRPAETLTLEPARACRLGDALWQLEKLTASPFAVTLWFHLLEGDEEFRWEDLEGTEIHLRDRVLGQKDCVWGASSGGGSLELTIEFQMPLDTSLLEQLVLGGEVIPLK